MAKSLLGQELVGGALGHHLPQVEHHRLVGHRQGALGVLLEHKLAAIVTMLCRPEARWICGQTIIADGGYSLLA